MNATTLTLKSRRAVGRQLIIALTFAKRMTQYQSIEGMFGQLLILRGAELISLFFMPYRVLPIDGHRLQSVSFFDSNSGILANRNTREHGHYERNARTNRIALRINQSPWRLLPHQFLSCGDRFENSTLEYHDKDRKIGEDMGQDADCKALGTHAVR